jgi:hypothetical protein
MARQTSRPSREPLVSNDLCGTAGSWRETNRFGLADEVD